MCATLLSSMRRTLLAVASKSSLENGLCNVASGINHGFWSNMSVGTWLVAMITGKPTRV